MTSDALRLAAILTIGALTLSCGSADDTSESSDSTGDSATTDVEQESIDASSVEDQVAANLADLGIAPDRVDCPTGLAPEMGDTARCELELDGVTFGVTVEVASSDGEQALLSVKVDDQPS